MTTDLTEDWTTADAQALFWAFASLRNESEAGAFLRDLCTRQEIEEMIGRWRVARLLDEAIPYREIHERTGVSTATITRINQWLRHGTGGYRMLLDRSSRRRR